MADDAIPLKGSGSGGLSLAEIRKLESISLDQLDQLFMHSAKAEEALLANKVPTKNDRLQPQNGQGAPPVDNDPIALFNSLPDDQITTELAIEAMSRYANPATLENLAGYADGSTAARSLNRALPSLDNLDRMSITSLGNDRGSEQFLRQKFGADNVARTASGALTVKYGGDKRWYRIDPAGAGSGTRWERTKEIISDVFLDNVDTAMSVGIPIAAAAAAPFTGGASIAVAAGAGAAAGGAKVLLGSLLDTYDAPPEEMLKDIALETVFNAGGQLVGVMGRPAIGALFKRAAPQLDAMAPEAKSGLFNWVVKTMGGVNDDVAEAWIYRPKAVGDLVNSAKAAGASKSIPEYLTNKAVDETEKLALNIADSMYDWYGKGLANIGEQAGENFTSQVKPALSRVFSDYVEKGYGKIGANGEFILNSADDLMTVFERSKNPVPGISKAESYGVLKQFFKELNSFARTTPASGKEAMSQFVKFDRWLSQQNHSLPMMLRDQASNDVADLMTSVVASIENAAETETKLAFDALKKPDLIAQLDSLKAQYGEHKKAMKDVLSAVTRYKRSGDRQVFANLYNNVFSNNSLSTKRAMGQNAIKTAVEAFGTVNPDIMRLAESVVNHKAAIASQPLIRQGFMGQAGLMGAFGTGNLGFAAGTLFSSPKVASKVAQYAGQPSTFVKNAINSHQWMLRLPPAMKKSFFSSPEAINMYFKGIYNASAAEDGIPEEP